MRYGWRVRQSLLTGEWVGEVWHHAVTSVEGVTCVQTSPEFPFRGDAEGWAVGLAKDLTEAAPPTNEITWVDA